MSGWEVNVPVLHWLWNNNIPHEGNRSMHNQTLALFSLFRWSASVVVFKALMHFLVHDALVFVHVDCLCFRDVSITSCILPLGEFDWFIRRNMKPVALRPFLYLSYRWCVFTLAYYFILQVEDHSNHAHNKPEKKTINLWLHKRFTYVKTLFYTKNLIVIVFPVFFACTLYQGTLWSNSL